MTPLRTIAAALLAVSLSGCGDAHGQTVGVGVGVGVGGSSRASANQTPIPSFDFNPYAYPGGVDALDQDLTINGTTVSPTFVYYGGDCDATSCVATAGTDLPIVSVATEPTYNDGSPLLGSSNDDSVLFNASDYYRAASGTYGDADQKDIVLELLFQTPQDMSTFKTYVSKWSGAPGWLLSTANSGAVQATIHDGTTQRDTFSAALTEGAWYFVAVYIDRSGSAQIYINGVASGAPVNVTAASGSLNNATAEVALGAYSSGTTNSDGNIAYAAFWVQDAWLDTHLQATVAAERFAKLTGTYHNSSAPSTATRATVATLTKVESAPNLMSSPEDITATAAWTSVRSGTPSTSVTDPNGSTCTTCALSEESEASTTHYLRQTVTVDAVQHTFTAYAKQANRTFVVLDNTTLGTARAYFDLSDCTVGTTEANVDSAWSKSADNGWCFVSATYTPAAGANNWDILIGESDGDVSFTGLDQDSIYLFDIQLSDGKSYHKVYQVGAGWLKVEDDPVDFRENLVLHSEDPANTVWTLQGATVGSTSVTTPVGTTSTTSLIIENTSLSNHGAKQDVTLGVSTITLSAYVKADGREWVRIENSSVTNSYVFFNASDGSVGTVGAGVSSYGIQGVDNGWYRIWITDSAATGTNQLRVIAANSSSTANYTGDGRDAFYLWGMHVEYESAPTAYIPTTTSAVRVSEARGFKSEAASTNIVPFNTDLTNATGGWVYNNATGTHATASPNGEGDATDLVDDNSTGTGTVHIRKSVTVATSTTHTLSVFAKSDQLDWLYLEFAGNGALVIDGYFNLSTGETGTLGTDTTSASVVSFGDGWYRCGITFDTDAADTTGFVRLGVADADTSATVDLDGTSSILIWRPQIEAQPLMTSMIETAGASATRNVDDLRYTIVDGVDVSDRGSLVVKAVTPSHDSPTNASVFGIAQSGSNYVRLRYQSSDQMVGLVVNEGGTECGIGTTDDMSDGEIHTVSLSYQTNECRVFQDGVASSNDLSATIPTGYVSARIGSAAGSQPSNALILRARAFIDSVVKQ